MYHFPVSRYMRADVFHFYLYIYQVTYSSEPSKERGALFYPRRATGASSYILCPRSLSLSHTHPTLWPWRQEALLTHATSSLRAPPPLSPSAAPSARRLTFNRSNAWPPLRSGDTALVYSSHLTNPGSLFRTAVRLRQPPAPVSYSPSDSALLRDSSQLYQFPRCCCRSITGSNCCFNAT